MGLYLREKQKGTYWYYVKRPDIKPFSTGVKCDGLDENKKIKNKSSYERTKKMAQDVVYQKLQNVQVDNELLRFKNVTRAILLTDAIVQYKIHLEATKKAKNSRDREGSSLNKFQQKFSDKYIFHTNREKYLQHYELNNFFVELSKKNAEKTLKNDNGALNNFYKWCKKKGYYPTENTNPNDLILDTIKEIKCSGKTIEHNNMSNEQFGLLIQEEPNKVYRDFYRMLYYTGLNFTDIYNLKPTNVLDDRIVVLRAKQDQYDTKDPEKRWAIIPKHNVVSGIDYNNLNETKIQQLRRSMQTIVNGRKEDEPKVAKNHSDGDGNFCIQCFRHTFSTNMDTIGLTDPQVKFLLGHLPPSITQGYIHNNQTKKPIDPEIVEAVHSLPHF